MKCYNIRMSNTQPIAIPTANKKTTPVNEFGISSIIIHSRYSYWHLY